MHEPRPPAPGPRPSHPGASRQAQLHDLGLGGRAREAGVSFATRGNLIIVAPPLVIEEKDLLGALALMERLLEELEWS